MAEPTPSPPNDTSSHRSLVQKGYDAMATRYATWAESQPSPRLHYVDEVLSQLTSSSSSSSGNGFSSKHPGLHVLELGCGAGVPVTQLLASRCSHVTANDLSTSMLALARQRLQGRENVEFVPGSMTDLQFADETFDAVVSFFAIFHLSREDQIMVMKRIRGWLKPGGFFTGSFSGDREGDGKGANQGGEEDLRGQFCGEDMFWCTRDVRGTEEMMREAGLEVERSEVLVAEAREETDPDYGRKFLWVVARKAGVRGGGGEESLDHRLT